MATNWNTILSNTKNLNDVLAILRKILGQTDKFSELDIDGILGNIDAQVKVATDNFDSKQVDALNTLKETLEVAKAAGAGANGWLTDIVATNITDAATQELFNQKGVTTVESVADLAGLAVWEGRTVNVTSYNKPDYSSPVLPITEGGGSFRYVGALKGNNDGGICINGWVRQKATYNYLTPEMFGAKGIGESFDDYTPIQNMLNAGAAGCTFEFDGSKTYYNAFANDGTYIEPLKRNVWTRSSTATFKFNNCKITRAKPIGDENDTSNTKYTDQDTALLRLKNAEYYLYDMHLDANATLGTFVNTDGSEIATTKNLYYVANTGTYGLHLQSCTKVRMYNVTSNKAYFNMFIDGCKDVKGWGVTLIGAIQSPIKNSAPNDLNFGAGAKVWFSDGVELHGIYGTRNANATIECEKFNKNCVFSGRSEYDYSNSLVIQASKNIGLDWRYDNVVGGTGVYINDAGTGAADDYCSGITGKIRGDTVAWCGVLLEMKSACVVDFTDINLDIYTSRSSYCGLSVSNASNNAIIDSAKINHISYKDTGTLFSRVFNGRMTGRVTGSSSGCTYGLFVRGTNTAKTCMTFALDLRSCTVPYVVDSTAFAEFDNLITSSTAYRLTTVINQSFGVAQAGMSFNNYGTVQFNHFASKTIPAYNVLPNMTQANGSEVGRMYIDPATRTASGNGYVYTMKMYMGS
ncbi:hypothetical protein [Acinetobacter rathckeae]|uniref:hypothetical protein n=1 Tax=Acinetobacter rathckeae TaxID=2605272 RepID=UPI0018A2E90A|nr:hypothetical protein [Acinetobacter rathckeae]MBF7687094.1 hypothetical protein [Acinetobacter rathckeae]